MAYKIGTNTTSLTDLESLATTSVPYPRSVFKPYSEQIPLNSGGVRGAGAPTVEWQWGFLTQAQRDKLRTYCTGASATVYIETKTVDSADTYATYSGDVVWPEQEERETGRRLDFVLVFKNLVAVV